MTADSIVEYVSRNVDIYLGYTQVCWVEDSRHKFVPGHCVY